MPIPGSKQQKRPEPYGPGRICLLQNGTALKSLHVRETINALSEQLRPVARYFLGKYNSEANRVNVKARVDSVLDLFLANGSLSYARSVVDTSNNTDEVIANQMGIIDVEIVVSGVAEKVVIRTTTYNSEAEIGFGLLQ